MFTKKKNPKVDLVIKKKKQIFWGFFSDTTEMIEKHRSRGVTKKKPKNSGGG